MNDWTEPGRSVAEDGRIVYAWPPAGRFRELWERFSAAFDDDEKTWLLALLRRWQHEESTLVAYTDPVTGQWVEVEPDWTGLRHRDGWTEGRHERDGTATFMTYQWLTEDRP